LINFGVVPREQLLNALEQNVPKAVWRMERDLFHGLIAFGERNAAELRGSVDGEDHLFS
jgi:hypothetical protein